MNISHHAGQRMNQRGIPRRLVEFTMKHGRIEGDKRVLDKGGVTVVESGGTVVTTYNSATTHPKPRRPAVIQVGSLPEVAG